jgi:hypothetical protein
MKLVYPTWGKTWIEGLWKQVEEEMFDEKRVKEKG